MHTQFAAWINQIESQLAPQIARQPAVAERTGSPKLQLAQLHLQTVYRISGNLPIFWKQTQRPRTLSLFVKYVQTLPPCTFLLIVDLTEIQHRPLCCLARRQAAILNDAEVPMLLPILLSVFASQKHRSSRMTHPASKQK